MRPSNSRQIFDVGEHRTGRGKGATMKVMHNRFVSTKDGTKDGTTNWKTEWKQFKDDLIKGVKRTMAEDKVNKVFIINES